MSGFVIHICFSYQHAHKFPLHLMGSWPIWLYFNLYRLGSQPNLTPTLRLGHIIKSLYLHKIGYFVENTQTHNICKIKKLMGHLWWQGSNLISSMHNGPRSKPHAPCRLNGFSWRMKPLIKAHYSTLHIQET